MKTAARSLVPLLALASIPALVGCPTPGSTVPRWTTTAVAFGQGRLLLGIRFRWVAQPDPAGALIRTPEGGQATVRVFFCGQPFKEVKEQIQRHLRSRLIGAHLEERGRALLWRWREKRGGMIGPVLGSVVARHGPLLIAASSATIELDDLARIARQVRLEMPVPAIPSCLPLCEEGLKCAAETSDDEG